LNRNIQALSSGSIYWKQQPVSHFSVMPCFLAAAVPSPSAVEKSKMVLVLYEIVLDRQALVPRGHWEATVILEPSCWRLGRFGRLGRAVRFQVSYYITHIGLFFFETTKQKTSSIPFTTEKPFQICN